MSSVFKPGHEYTRAEIHEAVGGSRVSCLPSVGGVVVAACLLKEFSPQAPEVMLCGQGPRTGPISHAFAQQRGALPVFIKLASKRWQYQGEFVVRQSFRSGAEFERLIAGSGRSLASVSCVVVMERVGEDAGSG